MADMHRFGDKDTKHMLNKKAEQAEPGLMEDGPRASETVNLARGGFEHFTTKAPVTVHSISSECGGLAEGNRGVDTSGWYEGPGHNITKSERDELGIHSARLPED